VNSTNSSDFFPQKRDSRRDNQYEQYGKYLMLKGESQLFTQADPLPILGGCRDFDFFLGHQQLFGPLVEADSAALAASPQSPIDLPAAFVSHSSFRPRFRWSL
jgi:hypothetical protein